MGKNANIKAALDYAIAKLESQKKMSVEEKKLYKELIIERQKFDKKGYNASWNPLWSIITNLVMRVGEEVVKNL